jgi:hypothetical protein
VVIGQWKGVRHRRSDGGFSPRACHYCFQRHCRDGLSQGGGQGVNRFLDACGGQNSSRRRKLRTRRGRRVITDSRDRTVL